MAVRIMYYPKQIPYLLSKEFKENIKYKEYQIKELSEYCMCIWTMQSEQVLDKTIYNNILPDACIDIVIDFTEKTICFAGFSRETVQFELNKKIDFMGVRLKPGSFYSIFGISSDKIMDSTLSVAKTEGNNNLEKILNAADTGERIEILKSYLLEKIKQKPNTKFINIAEDLYISPKEQNVIAIAENYGCNERQLYRIFKTNYGVSPKVLLNILRLHLCLTLIMDNNMKPIDVANICGFYDQAHFIREVKRYTGFSPLQLLEKYR